MLPLGLIVKCFVSSQGFAVVVSSIYRMVPLAIERVCQVHTEVSQTEDINENTCKSVNTCYYRHTYRDIVICS